MVTTVHSTKLLTVFLSTWHTYHVLRWTTCTIRGNNLIKWCQWDHLLEGLLKGLRVRAAGLKLFIVSINDLQCQLCIGGSLRLNNNGAKLCMLTDIFVTSYSFWLVTPKTISRHNQKTDTTAQLEKKFLQPTRSECIHLSVSHSLCPSVRAKRGIWSKRVFMRTKE
jgi:hypothetical protein